jgi:hypothetical protein
MLRFTSYLVESIHFLTEETGKESDAKGKLRELNLGKYLNGGKHMDSYRAQGKEPIEVAHGHNTTAFGAKYATSLRYAEHETNSKMHAGQIIKHLQDHGYGKVKRSVWTSQPADHKSETGVEDTNNSADNILTMNKQHARNRKKFDKIALSIKTGHNKVNYSNPGLAALAVRSGANLTQHTKQHADLVSKLLPAGAGSPHDRYKALRDSPKKTDQALAAQIKQSSVDLNRRVSNSFRRGLAVKKSDELKQTIRDEIAPATHLKHLVSREITDEKTGRTMAHKIYDLHGHVDDYLNHFQDLHVKPSDATSVTIHGTFQHPTDAKHALNGKVVPIATWAISAGGKPTNASPRGTVNLTSEDTKKINWHHTRRSELHEYDHQGKLVKQH